ncbi:MAG: tetratricopeptide repeat protein [Leptolyngbya sp. BL-A-14]
MPRVALLVGVSRYLEGLDPLPNAQKDVEVMRRVLKQPQFRFESVQSLCDRPLQEMQETIELFFRQRVSDDQIVFLLCGHTVQDADGALYFATPSTQFDEQGTLVKAQVIPAIALQEIMNSSPAKQQVVILDSYCQQRQDQPITAPSTATLATPLEGAGRVLLVAANVVHQSFAAIDAWTYPRYLAEGVESGAADTDDDGMVTVADWHDYASQKLRVAAPTLETQLIGSAEMAHIPLLEVPQNTPQIHYRKVLEAATIDTDAVGVPILEGRSFLNGMRHSLGVPPQVANELETQVLRPVQEYQQRLAFYQEHVERSARTHNLADPHHRQLWKQLQQALYLKDQDVAITSIAPFFLQKQHQQAQDQERLAKYQQVLLWAMQRRLPLRESDRAMLQRLQQTLHLKDDEVQALEAQLTTQAEQFVADDRPADADAIEPPTPDVTSQATSAQSLEPDSSHPVPSPLAEPLMDAPAVSGTPDDSRAKEVILERLFSMNEPAPLLERPSISNSPASTTVIQEESPPILPNAKPSPMDRIRRSASNSQALIIPAILLAAILGLLAAILPSSYRPNWFKFGQQTPADPAAAQQLNYSGLQKAQAGYNKEAIDDYSQAIQKNPNDVSAYTNRGISYHRLGDTGAAIRDYEQALKLDPKSPVLHSNLSYAYYDRQNYDKALEEGNQAVALGGNLAQAHINLANARSKKGDYNGALQDYNQAIRLNPPPAILAGAYSNRGNAQLALNNTSAALADYNQAIQLKPDYADAYYNLGVAQQTLNNRPAAIRSFQVAAAYYQKQGKQSLQKEANDRIQSLQQSN